MIARGEPELARQAGIDHPHTVGVGAARRVGPALALGVAVATVAAPRSSLGGEQAKNTVLLVGGMPTALRPQVEAVLRRRGYRPLAPDVVVPSGERRPAAAAVEGRARLQAIRKAYYATDVVRAARLASKALSALRDRLVRGGDWRLLRELVLWRGIALTLASRRRAASVAFEQAIAIDPTLPDATRFPPAVVGLYARTLQRWRARSTRTLDVSVSPPFARDRGRWPPGRERTQRQGRPALGSCARGRLSGICRCDRSPTAAFDRFAASVGGAPRRATGRARALGSPVGRRSGRGRRRRSAARGRHRAGGYGRQIAPIARHRSDRCGDRSGATSRARARRPRSSAASDRATGRSIEPGRGRRAGGPRYACAAVPAMVVLDGDRRSRRGDGDDGGDRRPTGCAGSCRRLAGAWLGRSALRRTLAEPLYFEQRAGARFDVHHALNP